MNPAIAQRKFSKKSDFDDILSYIFTNNLKSDDFKSYWKLIDYCLLDHEFEYRPRELQEFQNNFFTNFIKSEETKNLSSSLKKKVNRFLSKFGLKYFAYNDILQSIFESGLMNQ